mmetsp:Transcript_29695/g.74220  ORF Transcript_29695/g.74220 Transcript_29695/m.74220 type:complete len:286 (-) Transcript_29695:2754-3611(-)
MRHVSSRPLSFSDTCVSQVVRPASPSLRSAHSARCGPGTFSIIASTHARRPDTVSNTSISATKVFMVPAAMGGATAFTGVLASRSRSWAASVDAGGRGGTSAIMRSTFFTSSLPSVASLASRRICSRCALASSSNTRRALSRAATSSSGPSSSSSSSLSLRRRPLLALDLPLSFLPRFPFFTPPPPPPLSSSSSSSSSSLPSESESDPELPESSPPSASSSSVSSLNTSSKGAPASPVMRCSAWRAARHPVIIAPPTVSGCSLHVCSPANSRRPPLVSSGRPISS